MTYKMRTLSSQRRWFANHDITFFLIAFSFVVVSFPSAPVEAQQANERIFHHQVNSALDAVRSILESSKSPRRILDPSEVDHEFDDKFTLAEYLVNVAVVASVNAIDRLGIDEGTLLLQLRQQVEGGQNVKLRFSANETCSFVEKKVVEIVDANRKETYETTAPGDPHKVEEKTTTTRAVREVIEYHWRFNLAYKLIATTGSAESTITSREGSETIVVTGSERAPCQPQYSPPNLDVDLSWLLQQLSTDVPLKSSFRINRDVSSCLTPRRNEDVEKAIKNFEALLSWARGVSQYYQVQLVHRIMPYQNHNARTASNGDMEAQTHNLADLFRSVSDTSIFVPVLPLFHDGANSTDPVILSSDVDKLLREQCTTMDSALSILSERFQTPNTSIASPVEARMVLISKHLTSLAVAARSAIAYVEDMLRSQLVAAIGREVTSHDFDQFLMSYYPKLFRAEFVPEPFVYAVRRPNHFPDGVLAIESATSSSSEWGKANTFEPILTFSRKIKPSSEDSVLSIQMPINAATKIQLEGDQYLHSWIRHDITGMDTAAQIVARARQFSSFLLVIGNISGSGTIQPKSAIIVQNKDEVFIPLLLEPLPTPKEFKDAIQSLSPEQRDFAKAFRAMQLESSVFALAVIQLKPQLEFILGLPHDSLAKETKLTQELLELFIKYQISPDQLSFDGEKEAAVSDKLARVKENVEIVQSMINDAQEKELKEAERQSEMKAGGKKYNRAMESRSSGGNWGDDELMEDAVMADAMETNMMHSEENVAPKMQRRSASQAKRMLMSTSVGSDGTAHASASAHGTDQHLRAHLKANEAPLDSDYHQEATSQDHAAKGLGNSVDFSQLAKAFDAAFDKFDADSVLRPTKISVKEETSWVKNYQQTLLSPQEKSFLSQDDKRLEKDSAFDLLEALSRSGAQSIQYSELHVVVAATHRFDSSIIDTVVQSNENPIISVERSALIVASTLHELPVADLLIDQGEQRLATIERHSPLLLEMGTSMKSKVAGAAAGSGHNGKTENDVEPALL